jgi:L-ribulose-5-phosphate 3-epimerase UlaE
MKCTEPQFKQLYVGKGTTDWESCVEETGEVNNEELAT